MPISEEQYFADRAEADARRLGMQEKHALRKSRESGAASGTLYSGVQTRREGQVMADTQEQMRQASLDRDTQRYAALQSDLDRQHQQAMQQSQQTWQSGENQGSYANQMALQQGQQAWGTGEREGTQGFTTQQNEQLYGFQQNLQTQQEAAHLNLQNALQSGQITQQQFQQEWQGIQNELNNDLAVQMQNAGFSQDQIMAALGFGYQTELNQGEYGQQTAMQTAQNMADLVAQSQAEGTQLSMQDIQNQFEQGMAAQGHEWDLARQDWDEMMANLDMQVQLTINGFDWDNDGNPGGYPLSFFDGAGTEGYTQGAEDDAYYARPGSPPPPGANPNGQWVRMQSGLYMWIAGGGQ